MKLLTLYEQTEIYRKASPVSHYEAGLPTNLNHAVYSVITAALHNMSTVIPVQ